MISDNRKNHIKKIIQNNVGKIIKKTINEENNAKILKVNSR